MIRRAYPRCCISDIVRRTVERNTANCRSRSYQPQTRHHNRTTPRYLCVSVGNQICPSCNGTRLRKEARNVLVGDMNLHHICELPLRKAFDFFNTLNLEGNKAQVASKLVNEIKNRLHFLINVGLDYLSLSRSADTLSGVSTRSFQRWITPISIRAGQRLSSRFSAAMSCLSNRT